MFVFASRIMAETDEADVQTKKSKTLIVRHLPRELSKDEKEDLLKYFGASSVRALSEKGPLVSCQICKNESCKLLWVNDGVNKYR